MECACRGYSASYKRTMIRSSLIQGGKTSNRISIAFPVLLHLLLVVRIMYGAIPPLLQMPSWH
jgi:hypothetical protein